MIHTMLEVFGVLFCVVLAGIPLAMIFGAFVAAGRGEE